MTTEIKQALSEWTEAVTAAISRGANGKDVDWREVVSTNRMLQLRLVQEPTTEPAPTPAQTAN